MKGYKAILNPQPKVIIIRCSDPRFRIAFGNFTKEELGLSEGEFIPINVAGGPAVLAHRKTKHNDFEYLRSQILFFFQHFGSIIAVTLIGHEDCGFYKTIANHPDKEDREKKDLPRAAEELHKILGLPKSHIKTYYASFANKSRTEIVFEDC